MEVKTKPTISGAPQLTAVVDAAISAEFADIILSTAERFMRTAWGPAEGFQQVADSSVFIEARGLGCTVQLTGLTVTRLRAHASFWELRDNVHALYSDLIRRQVAKGIRVQLWVQGAIDKATQDPDGHLTTLVEGEAEGIEGEAEVVGTPDV